MTNEELTLKIQAGQQELIEELWLQVERFVRQQAYKEQVVQVLKGLEDKK